MFCKSIKSSKFWRFFIAIGIISIVFGTVSTLRLPDDVHDLSMLMGMFTGMGTAFIAIGIIRLIHLKVAPPEKLKQEEIELNDERNIQILRIAYTVANVTSTILFAVMAFVFVFLGYRTPALISIGAIYVQLLAFFIAYKYYGKKM